MNVSYEHADLLPEREALSGGNFADITASNTAAALNTGDCSATANAEQNIKVDSHDDQHGDKHK